ncbi:MAG: ABC transporter ATP-binding protein/permease [Actinobacteria bacterium]|nr:ABC transporter ATP-binding protein/permease [Actinomycetota bacterium]
MSDANDGELRSGLGLMRRTLVGYRAALVPAVGGALLWMAMVVTVPYLVGRVVDVAIAAGDRDRLVPGVTLVLGAGLLLGVGIGVRRYFGFKLSYRAEADLRNRMFEHIQRLAFSFHDVTSTGELMARASSDLSQMRLVFAMLPITVANIGMFLSVVTVLIVLDPVLGLVSSLTVPILLLASRRYAGRVIGLSFEVQQRLADLTRVVEEAVGGVQVIKSYGQEPQEQARLDRAAARIYGRAVRLAWIRAAYQPAFEMIPTIANLAVLWLGGMRVIDGSLSLGEFVSFTQYLAVLNFPLRLTGWFFAQLPRAGAAASRIQALLATAPAIADPDPAETLRPGPGEVRFHDVRFGYPDSPPVLDGIDLVIPGGGSVALVGGTGAGKTTLAHLVPRFHDVGHGAITLDGTDIRMLRLDELRNEVAVVFQETFLFSASVRDNIAFGDVDASDHQIRLAARLAQAHDFIAALPDGYDTVVGERGHSLSGGQRQRVALARAVLRDPRVLILDDATSSVDAIVEAEMLAALERVMVGRTTIIIAHRTSTLDLVDQVVFLEDGRIAAVGTHRELITTVPRYSQVLAQVEEAS